MKHNVGEQVGCPFEIVLKHSGIVHGFLLGSVGIEVATYAFQPVDNVTGATMGRTFER